MESFNPNDNHYLEEKKTEWSKRKEILESSGFEHGERGIEKHILDTVVVLNLLGMNTA